MTLSSVLVVDYILLLVWFRTAWAAQQKFFRRDLGIVLLAEVRFARGGISGRHKHFWKPVSALRLLNDVFCYVPRQTRNCSIHVWHTIHMVLWLRYAPCGGGRGN